MRVFAEYVMGRGYANILDEGMGPSDTYYMGILILKQVSVFQTRKFTHLLSSVATSACPRPKPHKSNALRNDVAGMRPERSLS